jgi:hydroxymethylbilane synthase
LGLEDRISRYFSPEEMIPAAGQGVLAIQGRADMEYSFLEGFLDETARITSESERAFVRTLDGGCSSPIAAYAKLEGEILTLTGLYYNEETGEHRIGSLSGTAADAQNIGINLAEKLKGGQV